jgi:small subunit ribosomal protein S10
MKFRIFIKSFNKTLISNATKALLSNLYYTNINIIAIVSLPIKIKKFCVLRSPHVDKDSREQFEIRLYKNFIDIELDSPEDLNLLLKIEFPEGISSSLKVL